MSKVGDTFAKELIRVGSKLIREILVLLGRLETNETGIVTTKVNLELALRTEFLIREKINQLGYEKAYVGFKGDSLKLLRGLRSDNIKQGLSDELSSDSLLQLEALERSILDRDVRFVPDVLSKEISSIIYDGVLGTLSIDDLIIRVENKLKLRFDQASTLAEQYINAALNAITIGQAKEVGINYYLYSGVSDSLTRPFCRKMIDKIWTLGELDSLGDDSLRGKQPLPVSLHLGGFNCRYFLVPLNNSQKTAMIKSGEAERGRL